MARLAYALSIFCCFLCFIQTFQWREIKQELTMSLCFSMENV